MSFADEISTQSKQEETIQVISVVQVGKSPEDVDGCLDDNILNKIDLNKQNAELAASNEQQDNQYYTVLQNQQDNQILVDLAKISRRKEKVDEIVDVLSEDFLKTTNDLLLPPISEVIPNSLSEFFGEHQVIEKAQNNYQQNVVQLSENAPQMTKNTQKNQLQMITVQQNQQNIQIKTGTNFKSCLQDQAVIQQNQQMQHSVGNFEDNQKGVIERSSTTQQEKNSYQTENHALTTSVQRNQSQVTEPEQQQFKETSEVQSGSELSPIFQTQQQLQLTQTNSEFLVNSSQIIKQSIQQQSSVNTISYDEKPTISQILPSLTYQNQKNILELNVNDLNQQDLSGKLIDEMSNEKPKKRERKSLDPSLYLSIFPSKVNQISHTVVPPPVPKRPGFKNNVAEVINRFQFRKIDTLQLPKGSLINIQYPRRNGEQFCRVRSQMTQLLQDITETIFQLENSATIQ